MRKMGLFMVMALLLCGCGAQKEGGVSGQAEASVVQTETSSSETSEQEEAVTSEETEKEEAATSEEAGKETGTSEESTESGEVSAEDEQIKKEVEDVIKSAGSIQEEIKNIDALWEKYEKLLTEEDGSQTELNERARKTFLVWDVEINDLWKRMKSTLPEDVMKDLLEEQRRWVENKEEVVEETISAYKEGSIYPMYYHLEMAEVTRNRVYQLAYLFAQEKGESFEMPERSEVGKYIDDQGTGDVYSSLIIRHGMEGDTLEAVLTVYKLAQVEGTVKKKGDVLIFQSDDGTLTGKITYGWDGAAFEVTKVKKGSAISNKYVFEFPTAF